MRLLRWLYPGMKVKRWFWAFVFGIAIIVLGIAVITDAGLIRYATNVTKVWAQRINCPSMVLGILLMFGGCCLAAIALIRLVNSIIQVVAPNSYLPLGEVIFEKRYLEKGPKIVAIGGGTGLSVLLRGLKQHTSNITAVVSVADDGGSSGRLRSEMGILPPGDIRNCIVALADTEPLMEKLFQHRFSQGTMKGHSFGNLFIAAMTEVSGDFQEAIRQVSKVLAIRGRVFPVTLDSLELLAETQDGSIIRGESAIGHGEGKISRIWLDPPHCNVLPEVLDAIRQADAVILGPGSLYTSVIPPLLVPGIVEAIIASPAKKIHVCNIMTQPGETPGYKALDHVCAIESHTRHGIMEFVIVNTASVPQSAVLRYAEEGASPVIMDVKDIEAKGLRVVGGDMVFCGGLVRHNHERLAKAIMYILGLEG